MIRVSAILSKSRSLFIEACTTTRSSRVKPLESSIMTDRCHSLSFGTPMLSELFFGFMFCQREDHFPHMPDQRVDTTKCSINDFAQIIETSCAATNASLRSRRRLWTSLL